MASSIEPRPDCGAQPSDEAGFDTPATPWDQPDELTGDGTPGVLRPRRQAGGVHPGWASAPREAFDDAASGGWGVPGQVPTGPMPKIRRTVDAPDPDGEAPGEGH